MSDVKDETVPDDEGKARPGIVKTLEEFKLSVYGKNYDDNNLAESGKATEASQKWKAIAENAIKEYAKYDWFELADSGKMGLWCTKWKAIASGSFLVIMDSSIFFIFTS